MTYPRGYKLFEPLNPANPNPQVDNLIKTFNEGVDYQASDININFIETLANSTFLNGGDTEYRYFVAFDDENIGVPSNVFSLLNLMPPTNLALQVLDYDTIKVTYNPSQFASGYDYSIRNITNNLSPIQGVLLSDGSISGLNANTTYEIKLASHNSKNEKTEWCNIVLATTWVTLELTANIADKHITWNWQYDNTDATKFELINNKDGSVLYSGVNKTFSIDSPVTKLENFVRLTTSSGTIRNTKILISNIFHIDKMNRLFRQDTSKTDKQNVTFITANFCRDLRNIAPYQVNFYRDNSRKFVSDTQTYQQSNSLVGYRLSLYNTLVDSHIFYNDFSRTDKFNSYVKTDISFGVTKILNFNSNIVNTRKDIYNFINDYYLNFKAQRIPTKLDVSTLKTNTMSTNFITYQSDKIYLGINRYIYNTRTTPYGFDNTFYNHRITDISRLRQRFYNAQTSFDIDNVDFVTNAVITNIDVQSQVNKVRILCIGDSITAGAPLFDPQYGGTAYETDLITGKTKTRNVKESQYPYWLQMRLGIDDFEVINEGSGRRTSAEVEYHIKEQMTTYKPQYTIIMIGTNDIFQAQDSGKSNLANTVTTTLNNIRQTIDIIKENNGIPILGTQLPRNSIVPPEAKDALRSLNTGIKNLGIEYSVDVVDWYEQFVQHDVNGVENGVLRYDLSMDDTHPTIDGYKKMAYTINLGIFNSFRASFRLFANLNSLGNDVDYSSEESKTQPDPYTFNYKITFPELRRLERYVFSKYIKNTGNSWGLFVISLSDPDNICEVWDEKNQSWTNKLIGQLAPNQILELKMRYIMPSVGYKEVVNFSVDYIVKR